jgi:hypothetical protein
VTQNVHSARLNARLKKLHDEMKSLVLTCAPNFPREAVRGVDFLQDVADVQGFIAAYQKVLLCMLFDSIGGKPSSSPIGDSEAFTALWKDRAKLANGEHRPEEEIDTAIRHAIAFLVKETRILGDDELLKLAQGENLAEMLYYLNTIQGGLAWYAGRYIARLSGELAQMDG